MSSTLKKDLPKHIAIIMDGNGRWAKERGFRRTTGHDNGGKTLKDITQHCKEIGIEYLTLYAFSTENWSRPKLEVEFLMKLLQKYLTNELSTYLKNSVRLRVIGDISKFSPSLQQTINDIQNKTKHCTAMTQVLALNYGGQDEIVRAARKLQQNGEEITHNTLKNNLDTSFMPDVDLLIRTSGEVRLSNFLLWQNAYAEMFFTQTLWPDFTPAELDDIISDYTNRERRFGGV